MEVEQAVGSRTQPVSNILRTRHKQERTHFKLDCTVTEPFLQHADTCSTLQQVCKFLVVWVSKDCFHLGIGYGGAEGHHTNLLLNLWWYVPHPRGYYLQNRLQKPHRKNVKRGRGGEKRKRIAGNWHKMVKIVKTHGRMSVVSTPLLY